MLVIIVADVVINVPITHEYTNSETFAKSVQGTEMALAGGWRKGDRVTARIDQKVLNVSEGDVGSFMRLCGDARVADKEQRVMVDFDNKGLNVNVYNIQGVALAGG